MSFKLNQEKKIAKIGYKRRYLVFLPITLFTTLITLTSVFAVQSKFQKNLFEERKNSAAGAVIDGILIDENFEPVKNAFIELHFYQPNPKFSFFSYFKLAKTDAAGYYAFRELPPGNYFIGINLGRSPSFDNPYRRTFFPGTPEFSKAQIIGVGQGQRLTIPGFLIPPRLKTVKITGKIIWSDEIKAKMPNLPFSQPNITLLDTFDANDLDSIASSGFFSLNPEEAKEKFSAKKIINIDKEDNFTLNAFEGYSYILHAHAFIPEENPNPNRALNAMHINKMIVAYDNISPVELKLEIPGVGNDHKLIKEELKQYLWDSPTTPPEKIP